MSPLRYFSRFEKADSSASLTFPTHRYEWEQSQPLRGSTVELTGAHYLYDQLEGAPAVKGNGLERVRCMSSGLPAEMDDDIDDIKAIASWGRGKAWTSGASGERWAWARLVEMPQLSFTVENVSTYPIIMLFERFSDWYDEDPIGEYENAAFTVGSDPETVFVTNPGNIEVDNAVITVKGPFSGLVITNDDTGYVLESSTVGGAGTDWLRFDAGRNTVEVSDDSGSTWTDDQANFVRAPGQIALMKMQAGVNSLTIEGANGADVVVEMYGAHH